MIFSWEFALSRYSHELWSCLPCCEAIVIPSWGFPYKSCIYPATAQASLLVIFTISWKTSFLDSRADSKCSTRRRYCLFWLIYIFMDIHIYWFTHLLTLRLIDGLIVQDVVLSLHFLGERWTGGRGCVWSCRSAWRCECATTSQLLNQRIITMSQWNRLAARQALTFETCHATRTLTMTAWLARRTATATATLAMTRIWGAGCAIHWFILIDWFIYSLIDRYID